MSAGLTVSVRFGGFNGYIDDLHVQSGVLPVTTAAK